MPEATTAYESYDGFLREAIRRHWEAYPKARLSFLSLLLATREAWQVAWDRASASGGRLATGAAGAAAVAVLLRTFNARINLISREDEENLFTHHILHSLSLARFPFPDDARVADWGTGGGLPAIPLAIQFPRVTFYAIDAVDKKVRAVRSMARRLGLPNVQAVHVRAEQWAGEVDYSVSRATAPLATLWEWHRAAAASGRSTRSLPALRCLKGGDLRVEIEELKDADPEVVVESVALTSMLDEPYFGEKCILAISTHD